MTFATLGHLVFEFVSDFDIAACALRTARISDFRGLHLAWEIW
jgi:hypothetical protein